MPTWNASQYLKFDDQRTRPCRELVARIRCEEPRRVIDLGCGPGNSTAVLAERWPHAELTGLDGSQEMITAAQKTKPDGQWQLADIEAWAGANDEEPYDIVFSNAALQWVGNHEAVFPNLLRRVAPGGVLAVQMPGNVNAPAHRVMRELARSAAWKNRFPERAVREWDVRDLPFYYDALTGAAASLDLWETEYQQVMPDANAIVEWYKGTGLRPFLEALSTEQDRADFCADYLKELQRVYPASRDGRVLFPFRRLFLIAYKRS